MWGFTLCSHLSAARTCCAHTVRATETQLRVLCSCFYLLLYLSNWSQLFRQTETKLDWISFTSRHDFFLKKEWILTESTTSLQWPRRDKPNIGSSDGLSFIAATTPTSNKKVTYLINKINIARCMSACTCFLYISACTPKFTWTHLLIWCVFCNQTKKKTRVNGCWKGKKEV